MFTEAQAKFINTIDKTIFPQRRDSLDEQLKDLFVLANKFGLYDAADFISQNSC